MKKHFFLWALLLLCTLPTFAHDFEVDGIYYNRLGGDSVEVTYQGDDQNPTIYTGDITLQSTVAYNDSAYRVTAIGAIAFDGCFGLTSVTIPNSVTTIDNSAFHGCSGLTSVTIPNSVTSIGVSAFRGCSGLTSVTIGNSVTTIGNNAFSGCRGLTSITIPNSVTTIGSSAFSGCSGLTSVTIPNSVTTIGYDAFYNCSGLTSVTIPDSVTTIGSYAFRGCSGLTSVAIPNSVTTISGSAFSGCTKLQYNTYENTKYLGNAYNPYRVLMAVEDTATSCTIHPQMKIIKSGFSFSVYPQLTSVMWSVQHAADFSQYDTPFRNSSKITSITFGENVEYIPAYLCYGMTNLTTITIPNENVVIGEYAFGNCPNISVTHFDNATYIAAGSNPYHTLVSAKDTTITACNIHSNTRQISDKAFYNCVNLTAITIPNSITTISAYAFYNCSALTSLTIPNSVKYIGEYAFANCTGLAYSFTADMIPSTVERIGIGAFLGACKNANVTLYNETLTEDLQLARSYLNIFGTSLMLTIDKGVISMLPCGGFDKDWKGCKVNYNGDVASWCAIDFGDGLGGTNSNPMEYMKNFHINGVEIKDLIVPDEVEKINMRAFKGCAGLTSLTLGKNLKLIDQLAFWQCTGLQKIVCRAAIPPVVNIPRKAFEDVDPNIPVIVPCGTLEAYKEQWSFFNNIQEEFLYSLVVNSANEVRGQAIISQDPTCETNSIAVIEAIPAEGYKFHQWSDGNKENPRTVEVLQDTTFTAEFIPDITDLQLKQTSLILEIGDSYYLNTVVEPKNADKSSLVWSSNNPDIVSIDNYIATAHAIGQATITVSTADNALSATCDIIVVEEDIEESDDVVVNPDDTSAEITWQPVSGAAYYVFVVYADENQVTKICTLTFNAWGHLTNLHFLPKKRAITPEDQPFNFTVTGLEENTTYSYSMTCYTEDETQISNKTGQFTTTGGTTTAVETLSHSVSNEVRKVLENGTIYILKPNGEKYIVDGRKVN